MAWQTCVCASIRGFKVTCRVMLSYTVPRSAALAWVSPWAPCLSMRVLLRFCTVLLLLPPPEILNGINKGGSILKYGFESCLARLVLGSDSKTPLKTRFGRHFDL